MKNHLVSGLLCTLFAAALTEHLPAQSAGWVPVRQVAIENDPTGYSSGRMTVTDVARGVFVSYACHKAQSGIADTWEWGGSHWTPRDPARVPAWRTDAMFVYDPQRGRTVMFGGFVGTINSSATNETWEWDGESWVLRALSPVPNARGGCAGAYDEARNRIVMFGGVNHTDTWEFDGTAWTQRSPANSPSARTYHSMVYDRIRQRVLLHGGSVGGAANGETWEWDGTNWTLLANYGPFVRNFAMVWDEQRNRAVVIGSWPQVGAGTWEWDGVGWSTRTLSIPFFRHVNAVQPVVAAYDPELSSVVVFAQGTRWRWTGSAWLAAGVVQRTPRGIYPAAHCADTLRNRIVLWSSLEGTWEWDGTTWALGPYGPGMRYAPMAFDSARGLSVLFGGTALNGASSDATFEWNGASWTQRSFANQPSPRSFSAMVYDTARQRVVLFGGIGDSSGPQPAPFFGDTWTYDGIAWTARAGGPSARAAHLMAYDSSRQVTVLWGGTEPGGLAAPTVWEWDGTSWAQRITATTPPPRYNAAMAFDPTRGAVVLAGGENQQTIHLNDTWSWNGTQWAQINAAPAFPARSRACMAFDPARQQLLVFGGFQPQYLGANSCCDRLDAAVLQVSPVTPVASTTGSGCSAGTPPRLGSSTPYLGNQDFAAELLDAEPNALGLIGISFGLQAQPLGPCTFYLQGSPVMSVVVTNAYGVAQLPMPLPTAPSFVGLPLVLQGAVLTNSGAYAGFDLTAARVLQLGH